MLKKLKKQNSGFTIIEVLIVLTIAGVILLIVFIAVPAMQRNSRNTQRRNDVANYASAVSEWASNNGGVLPSTGSHLTTANSGVNALANTSFLTTEPTAPTTAGTPTSNTATTTTFLYVPTSVCTTGGTSTSANASDRQFTILYATESSSGTAIPQCQGS